MDRFLPMEDSHWWRIHRDSEFRLMGDSHAGQIHTDGEYIVIVNSG